MTRFISAGAVDDSEPHDDAWAKARQQVDASKKPPVEPGKQEGGKSLYEVLLANKEAKQEAFEEQAKLKNQFRALDDDEVDFLDSVREAGIARETAIRQETAEQLEEFRKQRAAAEQTTSGIDAIASPADSTPWTKRKRRHRGSEHEIGKGPKLRKPSSAVDELDTVDPLNPAVKPAPLLDGVEQTNNSGLHGQHASKQVTTVSKHDESKLEKITQLPLPKPAVLGLGDYESDEDE